MQFSSASPTSSLRASAPPTTCVATAAPRSLDRGALTTTGRSTKLARGSFGGDIWHVHYRALDTTDVFSLNLNNMPGANLWSSTDPNAFRDRRVPSINAVDPNLKPMYQDQTNFGVEHQLTPTTVIGAHYVHNDLRQTIEDLGALAER